MAKYAVDFDTMDAAIQRYLRQYRHWPATYWADCRNPNSYIIYHILPDAASADNNERLGDIEISKLPDGALLEFKEGLVKERGATYEELRVIRHAEKAAASRLRPDNYDGDDEEQFAALRDLVESAPEVIGARLDLEAKLLNEAQARYGEFEARMEEVRAGVLDWLAEHGIEEVAKEPDKNHNGASGNQRGLPPQERACWEVIEKLLEERAKITNAIIAERMMNDKRVYNTKKMEPFTDKHIIKLKKSLELRGYQVPR